MPLGSLHPTISGGDDDATFGLPIPSEVLARQRVTEIILRQDRPDRKLRIVIYRDWGRRDSRRRRRLVLRRHGRGIGG